jgi:hypothetical protein
MKPLTDYLMEIRPQYEFVVRVADCDLSEDLQNSVQHGLSMYVVENITQGRRVPVRAQADFPSLGPCGVQIMEITLRYPTVNDQIRQIVAERLGISAAHVVVRTRKEDQLHEAQPIEPKKVKGSVLLNPELEAESGQPLVGQQRIDSMLKELQKHKISTQGK